MKMKIFSLTLSIKEFLILAQISGFVQFYILWHPQGEVSTGIFSRKKIFSTGGPSNLQTDSHWSIGSWNFFLK